MRRSKRLGPFLLLTAAGSCMLDGCSLLIDTSNLSGGASDEGGALRVDGSFDAPANDAPFAGDASTDGSVGCDATFCDDFDDGPLGAKWTRKLLQNGGSLDFGMPARSAPNALRARFSGLDSTNDRLALLEQDLGLGKHVRCDFSVFVAQPTTKDFNDVFRIHTRGSGVSDYFLYFGLGMGALILADDVAYPDGGCSCPLVLKSAAKLPDSRWVRVSIETDFTMASVSIDGTVVINDSFGVLVPDETLTVGVGGRAFNSLVSDTLFDDFSCTVTK